VASNATPRRTAIAALSVAAAGLIALWLAWLSFHTNLDRSCVVRDAAFLDLCSVLEPGTAAHLAALKSRIAANPGDANAHVELAISSPSAGASGLVAAAQRLAPGDPGVLMLQASAALERQDWARAVGPLVQLAEHRDNPQPALALARLVGIGQGHLLSPYLTQGSRWFARVLAQMPQAQAPLSSALALIAQAVRAGVIEAETVRASIHQLKGAGAWVDAYSLWLALQAKAVPTIYNASFDEPFQPDGFDWEVTPAGPPGRAGAIVERRGSERRGGILDIRFTGRTMALPLVRQYLFLGEGRYRLRGEYLAQQLRVEEGFSWVAQCPSSRQPAGRSGALADTGGNWQRFEFEFSVPRGCGAVTSLQLETQAPSEAALGARGRMAFDALSLEQLRP